jgi:hypothetical protein
VLYDHRFTEQPAATARNGLDGDVGRLLAVQKEGELRAVSAMDTAIAEMVRIRLVVSELLDGILVKLEQDPALRDNPLLTKLREHLNAANESERP